MSAAEESASHREDRSSRDAVRRALVDGRAVALDDAVLPITDDGVARGDGVFETIGVWGGRPFRLDDHLDRLAVSSERILLPPPDLGLLRTEALQLLSDVTVDAALRVYVTGSGARVLTVDHQPTGRHAAHLVPQTAPWIRPVAEYAPAGAKTMSYLPNMVASRAARAAGGDDALLVSLEGHILEGPTFAVCWAAGGVVHAPSTELGIVDSISRRTALEAARDQGLEVVEGAWGLDGLDDAEEVVVSSAVRDVISVRRVADRVFDGPTPVRDALAAAVTARRRSTARISRRRGGRGRPSGRA
jgi:branched-chain amino acid aminotransferase